MWLDKNQNQMKNTEIKTKRFLLRTFTDADLPNVFKGLSHPEVIKYYGISFKTLEETKEQMTWFADLEKNKTGIWWAICNPENTEFYGAAGFNEMSQENRKAEVGMWLLPDYWGNGILKEVMPAIVNYAFTELNLHRIEGFVESDNDKCKTAMAKVNFQYEGTMRDCEVKNGKLISIDIFATINRVSNL